MWNLPSYQRPFAAQHAHGLLARVSHAAHLQHAHHSRGRAQRVGCGVGAPMDAAIHHLTGAGWDWREDGVILTIEIDHMPVRVFVPLPRVWSHVHEELKAVGCPFPSGMGEPISVGSLFGSISHAVSSVAHTVSHAAAAVVPKAVQKAAAKVVKTAATVGKAAINSKIVRYGLDAAAVAVPALAPAAVALEAAHQAMEHVNEGIAAAKQIKAGIVTAANYAQAAAGLTHSQAVATIVQKAQAGDAAAQRMVGAFQHLALARAAAAVPNPHSLISAALQHAPQLNAQRGLLANIAHAAVAAKQAHGVPVGAAAHALKPYRVFARAA